jgi:hypothetical protein
MNTTVMETSSLKLAFQDAHGRLEKIRQDSADRASRAETEIIQDCHHLLQKLEEKQTQRQSRKRPAHNM